MSTQNADAFLRAVGTDDGEEEGVTRRRRKPPVPAEESGPPAPLTPSQERAAQHRTALEDPTAVPFVAPPRRRTPEPKQKTSVDLRWSLRQGLDALCERDRRGPKAELNDALEAHLRAKGIEIPEWTN